MRQDKVQCFHFCWSRARKRPSWNPITNEVNLLLWYNFI